MNKILVIEDNTEVRENISEILELAGYDAIEARNGKIGVELAVNMNPDLILCDVMMPELDGFGVLKILNQNAKTHDIPFIFLTAKADKSDFRKGMGLGADDYITKPFDDTDLLEAIEMRLEKAKRIQAFTTSSEENINRFFSEARAQEGFDSLSVNREIRKFRTKDYIYEEGQIPRWLYYVVSGKVKSFKVNDFGKELITKIYDEGEFFGYYSLLKEETYPDSTMAMLDSEIRLIPKDDFSLLLFNNRDFAAQFIKILAKEAEDVKQQLLDLAYSSVRKKVANALLIMAEKELKEDSGAQVVIQATRDDLSAIAGTAKETLIRTLSDFKAENIIAIDGHKIKILSPESLRNMPH
jgi:DNA-binding response OmpR family regulator